jgi:hypothetical protein
MKKTKYYGKILGIFLIGIFLMNFPSAISLASLYGTSSAAQTDEKTPTNLILDFDLTKVDTTLRPGDSGVLQIVLKNTGEQPAEKTIVRIYDTPKIKAQGRFELGRIDAGTSKTISKVIRVESDASLGLHTLSIAVIFDSLDSNGRRTDDVKRRWEIPIRVYGNPNFQLSLQEDIEFFKDVTQKLILKGLTKAVAKETSATLSSNCVTVIGSNKRYLGDLTQDQRFLLNYKIKPSSTGTCTLDITMEYFDVSGALTKEDLSVGIDIQPSDINFKIEDVVPGSLNLGCTRNLSIYIKNLGALTAKDVTAKLNLNAPFTALKTSEKYLGKIEAKETKDARFEILVDSEAEKRAYEIPLKIEYYDASGNKQVIEKSIGIEISGTPEISIALESSDPFMSGSKGKVSINVINEGFTNIKFLSLKLLPTQKYKVISRDEVYIGNLDSDDSDSEEFEIQLARNVKEGKIYLLAEIKYKEEWSNLQHIERKTIPLPVLSSGEYAKRKPSGAFNLIISAISLILGLFILVIVLWLLYRVLKLILRYLDKKIFKKKV